MAVNINVPSQVKTYANLAAFPATGALKTIYIAEDTNKTYRWTGSVYTEISASAAMTWGAIGGTLSNQTDLQSALDAKENTITAGTTSQYFRGDKTFQTLDKAAVGLGNVDNTSDANKPISTATQTALNAKQNTLSLTTTGDNGASTLVGATLNVPNYTLSGLGGVPTSRTLTINGVTQDLSANRTFTISTGITIGSTAIASGVVGRVLFEGAGNVVSESGNLFWDNTNGRLGIGTSSPSFGLDVNGTARVQGLLTLTNNIEFSSYNRTIANSSFPLSAISTNQVRSLNDLYDSGGTNGFTFYNNGGTIRGRIYATGNWYVGSSPTDAGFRLDVNGTARVSGQVDIVGLTTMQISTVQQINSRLVQFNVNGASGGWASGYEFRAGGNTIYGTATAFRIWGNSATNNRVGIGDLTEANLQNGSAQLYINSQITGGRNAGVRITPSTFSTTQFSGIQFDFNNKDLNGGAFLGTQYNPLNNGYDMDLVVLTTSAAPNSYAETARFMGKFNSFYVGTDKTLAVASAKLQVESTTQGFLPPRMTTTQKNAIATPAAGLMVYDTTLNVISYYNGTMWI